MTYTVYNRDTGEQIDCVDMIEARWHMVRFEDKGESASIIKNKYQFYREIISHNESRSLAPCSRT